MQLDYHKLLKTIPSSKRKVTLKQSKEKGVGLYALKQIEPGEVIAYYRVKVFRRKGYNSPSNDIYSFEVYRKNGQDYKRLIGDIYENSFPEATDNGVTYWAPFANEPTVSQKSNAEIDIDLQNNYINKKFIKEGDIVDYKLVATRTILPKEEILWYYGENYNRNYEVGR